MLVEIMTAAALVAAPNYYAEISPETAMEIQELVLDGEYREYLDFNGDGELNIADVVGVSRKYQDNCRYGNEITLDREAVNDIVLENYADDLIYWEIHRMLHQCHLMNLIQMMKSLKMTMKKQKTVMKMMVLRNQRK